MAWPDIFGGHNSLFPIEISNYQNDFWSREVEQ
jgi:hypothetical protein